MHMHNLKGELKDMKGMPGRFPDGTYICQGAYGDKPEPAKQTAEAIAKQYTAKVRVTERKIHQKPVYLIWIKV